MDVLDHIRSAVADRYRIERELGAGGMATVYLAEDLKHDRKVAIKVLKPELAAVLGAERFVAEITTTANLQHPHILPLHDSGDAAGNLFYVMPFIEGESLRDRLAREQLLPVDDAVRIAREVLAALDYAHRHSVVHRDIKPENVLLHDGSALVADFGIALAVSAAGGPRMTQTGLSLGTPSYMSPEQAMGERVIDGRTDIYAVGAMLYEMLIGEPPFTGPTAQAIVSRVLTEEPRSPTSQRKMVPANVDAAVRKALQKVPADRFASAADMSAALGSAAFGVEPGKPEPTTKDRRGTRRRTIAIVAGAAIVFGGAGAVVARLTGPNSPVGVPAQFSFAFPSYTDRNLLSMAVSPDGSKIVFTGVDSTGSLVLMMRALNAEAIATVPSSRQAFRPIFSPDSRQIAFLQDGALRRIFVEGGSAQTLLSAAGSATASWLSNDHIVVVNARTMRRVSTSGGQVDTLAQLDSLHALLGVVAVPGGKWLISVQTERDNTAGHLVRVELENGAITPLGIVGVSPMLVHDRLLYVDPTGVLYAVPFNLRRAEVAGARTVVASGVRTLPGHAIISASANGTIAFATGDANVASQLVVVDRAGKERPLAIPANPYRTPRFSPDGKRIVYTMNKIDAASNGDVWVYDIALERSNRLTFDGFSISPSWTADGRTIVFTRRATGTHWQEWKVPMDASGTAALYFEPRAVGAYEPEFTRDGKTIVYRVDLTAVNRDIVAAPVDSPTATHAIAASPFEEHELAVSPDGRWVAYVSDASGAPEVYVRRVDGAGGIAPVSRGGGKEPRWNGMRELLFRNKDSVVAVPIDLGVDARPGPPRLLFVGHYASAPWDTYWDVAADGRFLFMKPLQAQADVRLTVLLNAIR
ncbi:MAG TPA: protein kinase [Gemmatimonadaceae bacterium]|nr:protein kinase [Gemmatimonadaceae bacterium]